eukprot:1100102_1
MKLILAFLAILFTPALSYTYGDQFRHCKRPSEHCLERYEQIYNEYECGNLSGDPLFEGIFPCGHEDKRNNALGQSKVPAFILNYDPDADADPDPDADGVVAMYGGHGGHHPNPCTCVTGDACALKNFEDKCCERGGNYAAAGNIEYQNKHCEYKLGLSFFPVCIVDDCPFQEYLDWVSCKYVHPYCWGSEFHEFGGRCEETDDEGSSSDSSSSNNNSSSETTKKKGLANKITKDQGRGGRLLGRGGTN